jgi:hypothetical protein
MRKCLLVILLSLTACVPNRPFRQSISVYPRSDVSPYTLAFIEFDDMGEFWDRTQLNRAIDAIRAAKAIGHGQAIVVTFVHGWKNNASDNSGNVWGFRDELKDIVDRPGTGNIPVVGIYIGWRGAATNVPFLKELTFYNRRNAAIRIPGANITEALHKIMRTTKQGEDDRSKCVLIGHSFGAMVLERALTQSMVSLINDSEAKANNKGEVSIPSPADLIVFVNSAAPATEAKQFLGMLKAGHYHYRVGERDVPFFLAITSKGDTATEFLMPLGHWPSKVTKAMREYDLSDPAAHPEFPPGVPMQSTYYLHSTANSPVLQSHEIVVTDTPDRSASCAEVHQKWYCVSPKCGRWNDTPYWAMRMPVEIVPDHGTIFRPEFRRLLEVFLPMRDEGPRTLQRIAIPDLTSSQLDLSSKIQTKRRELEAAWVRHRNEKEGQDALKEARDILGKLNVSGACVANPDNVFQLLRQLIADIVNDPTKAIQIAEAMGFK